MKMQKYTDKGDFCFRRITVITAIDVSSVARIYYICIYKVMSLEKSIIR